MVFGRFFIEVCRSWLKPNFMPVVFTDLWSCSEKDFLVMGYNVEPMMYKVESLTLKAV